MQASQGFLIQPLASEDAVHAEQVRTKRLNGISQMEYKFEVKKKSDVMKCNNFWYTTFYATVHLQRLIDQSKTFWRSNLQTITSFLKGELADQKLLYLI